MQGFIKVMAHLLDSTLNAVVQVVIGILKRCEARLLRMTDMEKMVDFLRGEVPRWPHDKLQVCN